MEINWFVILATMVNFFILMFLLNRLFYKPVIKAMDERQARLAAQKAEAVRILEEANEQSAEYRQQLANIEDTRQTLLAKARQEAKEQFDGMVEKYQQEADRKREFFMQEVAKEQDSFLGEVREVLGESAVKLAGDIINTLAAEDLEHRTFSLFLEQVRSIDSARLADEASASTGNYNATLLSSKGVTPEQRKAIEDSLQEALGTLPDISYEEDPELVLGFELRFDTLVIQKNVRKYLQETQANILNTLEKMR